MPNTRSGASRTREGINEQIDRQMAGALGARNAARNLEPLMRDGGGQEEVNGNGGNGNGGNGNGGNGNGNGNGGGNGYNFRGFVPARECTYQDFLKCQPLSFNGTEGVVGLTRWFEKMETVFHISNCPEKYQVKYATMAPNEEDKVERFVGGLPDNIQGNVIVAEPTELQDAIRIAINLMDQKLKGYARSAKNKRRLENNPRDTRRQQPVFKRQNVRGQNVTRAYTAGNNEKKGDWTAIVTSTKHSKTPIGNAAGSVCYECGKPGHFRKDCPKLRNQNHRNKTRNKNWNKNCSNQLEAMKLTDQIDIQFVTRLIPYKSRKSPNRMLIDDDTGRISIRHYFDHDIKQIPFVRTPSSAGVKHIYQSFSDKYLNRSSWIPIMDVALSLECCTGLLRFAIATERSQNNVHFVFLDIASYKFYPPRNCNHSEKLLFRVSRASGMITSEKCC
ncbi:putative reverse transcriptase domain-containing protein [Tanacetum coccineum]